MPELVHISFAGQPQRHESAHLHVSGEALYADDMPLPATALHAAIGISTVAHGNIRSMDLEAVRKAPGVVCVITAKDVPGINDFGPVIHDDPILTEKLVQF